MQSFATDRTPVISAAQEAAILAHFRQLDWMDFLTDMYLCVEALGSDAVEKVVPLADPGTRESLRVPLQDELDHIAFGVNRLRHELARLQPAARKAYLDSVPRRIDALNHMLQDMGLEARALFEAVGTSYDMLCESLLKRKSELLQEVAEPLAA